MGWVDRILGTVGLQRVADVIPAPIVQHESHLVSRRESATTLSALRRQAEAVNLGTTSGMGGAIDVDDDIYRRLTTGAKLQVRDLTPLAQERMIEVCAWIWEGNPFARRLVTLTTDLVCGDGIQVQVRADDNRVQEVVDTFLRRNRTKERLREMHNAQRLFGELALPTGLNQITGLPVLGYLDPMQIKGIAPLPDNVLVADKMILKDTPTEAGKVLNIIREDPTTGGLIGDVFFHRVNSLPNGMRGRSDLLPLLDWLDMFDQYMFAEVERIKLLSAFAWDLEVTNADEAAIKKRVKEIGKIRHGMIHGHNEKEKLEPKAPDLKMADRSEAARMLRVHIAGTMGYPISHFGDIDSNRATIEGQNDVMTKTPTAYQKEWAGFLSLQLRFAIEQAVGKNPALFSEADPAFRIVMPEIAAKDIARAGTVLAGVASAMDTGIANHTVSKDLALKATIAMLKQLGVEADIEEVKGQIEDDMAEAAELQDEIQAEVARMRANPNAPVPGRVDQAA